jgi:hypothetical protein
MIVAGFVPDEGLGVVVPAGGPARDGVDEVADACEHASAVAAFGELGEPAFNQVEPLELVGVK